MVTDHSGNPPSGSRSRSQGEGQQLHLDNFYALRDNTIPPLDEERRGSWDQPPREDILLDSNGATMDQATFDRLPEYSRSIPSGVYPGKMWKRDEWDSVRHEHHWFIGWYGISEDPTKCTVNFRPIFLMEWKTMMGLPA